MQRTAIKTNTRKSSKRKAKHMPNYSIFADLASKYAQVTPPDPNQSLDPNQLQVGQQVYSPEGEAVTVVENPMDTTTTTVMPADQSGTDVPEGVQTLEESELAAQYSLQPTDATPAVTAQARNAQDALSVNWNDLQDIANDMNKAIDAQDMQATLQSLEDLFEIAMGSISMPEDTKVGSIFEDYAGSL